MFDIPVVLIVFRRLDSVKVLFEQIKKIQPSKMYIIADAPREGKEDEKKKCEAVRDFIKNEIDWKCDFHPIYAKKNKGCAKNICEGLTEVFQNEKYAIIFEDDGIPSQEFFRYAEYLLKKYEKDKRIQYIAGFNGIGDNSVIKQSYTFGKSTPMSGAFAMWADRWNEIDFQMKDWPQDKKKKNLRKYFYSREMYHVAESGLDDAMNKVHITGGWDFQVTYDLFKKNRYSIVPKVNLASNVGYDLDALHVQDKKEALRLKELMDFSTNQFEFPMDEPDEVIYNIEYDKLRQKKFLGVRGNYVERHIYYLRRGIKDIAYRILPQKIWHLLKRILVRG